MFNKQNHRVFTLIYNSTNAQKGVNMYNLEFQHGLKPDH